MSVLRVGDVEACSIVGRTCPEFGLLASATDRQPSTSHEPPSSHAVIIAVTVVRYATSSYPSSMSLSGTTRVTSALAS